MTALLTPMVQSPRGRPLKGVVSDSVGVMASDRAALLRCPTGVPSRMISSETDDCGRNEVLANAVRTTRSPVHKKKTFFYDNWRQLMPSQLASSSSQPDDALLDKIKRSELWAKYGSAMSLYTLEFLDAEVEMDYQKDATRRFKRWVKYMLNVICAGYFLFALQKAARYVLHLQDGHSKHTERLFWDACDSTSVVLIYGAQLAQYRFDREFVLRNFQEVLLFWSLMQASIKLFWTYWTAQVLEGHQLDPGSVSMAIIIQFVVFRGFRFFYYVIFNIVVIICYVLINLSAGFDNFIQKFQYDHELIIVTSVGLGWVSWHLEVQQRKDYVQAIASWRESLRTELLLTNILPLPIINQLKEHKGAISQSYEQVTIFFADVVSFTTMSAQVTPGELVELLNRMFRKIDQLADNNGVEKVKTIGDCYMAAAGLPSENPTHAQAMARFGLQMLSMMLEGQLKNPATGKPLQVRLGIHSGPCVAGVIGHKKFAYDIWGDAVNTAARMESHGEPMRLHCSGDSHALLKDDFVCESREPMTVKGKGLMQTYFVVAEHAAARPKSFLGPAWVPATTPSPRVNLRRSAF